MFTLATVCFHHYFFHPVQSNNNLLAATQIYCKQLNDRSDANDAHASFTPTPTHEMITKVNTYTNTHKEFVLLRFLGFTMN